MLDFQSTLDTADEYAKAGDHALAAFHYWLIGFAYENEEFPYAYTDVIGSKGRKGFLKHVKKHRDTILSSDSYINFKSELNCFSSYRKYFENFERVVNYFIDRKKNKELPKTENEGDPWIGCPY